MIQVLFVCLGNICRSPLAEAMFRHKIKALGLEYDVLCDSCGTGNYHIGSQPDSRTIAVAHKHGISIQHACRQLTAHDLDVFDYVIAMDKSNHQNILRLAANNQVEKVYLMRMFNNPPENLDVPDPYYGGMKDFQQVYDVLDSSLHGLINHLRGRHQVK
jgi:protein-tyrosine phosphatase